MVLCADVIMQEFLQCCFPEPATIFSQSEISSRVKGRTEYMNGFQRWEHFHCLHRSIGLQWPNTHNKESLCDSHIVYWKRWENLPAARARYPPCYPIVCLFWGYPGPQRCGDLPLPLCWERRGGEGGESANRLYHYCSLSQPAVSRERTIDNPQSSPSGRTDCELLDCLIIKNGFRLEALETCTDSPVGPFFLTDTPLNCPLQICVYLNMSIPITV